MPHEQVAPETEGVVIGNHTQKYTARNPAIRWLTERWVANLDRLFAKVAAHDAADAADGGGALEVGCGEGVIAARLQDRWGEVVALDLPDAGLRADWRQVPGPRFLHWTRRGFVRFVPEVREVTSPFPWTTVWATLPDHDGVNRG